MPRWRGTPTTNSPSGERPIQHQNVLSQIKRAHLVEAKAKPEADDSPHPADRHVGRQIAAVRVQSDVSQAQLARSIGISFQQLQKYENARNRVSASMLFEIAMALGVTCEPLLRGSSGQRSRCSSIAAAGR
ncbi:helix-turn-helix domain-containing protein [Aquamicrobium soli]|uniref:Helix-turn-helix domain-containing protein n=1 Tax=Aquamicrobium soli TaxID=1811518 RepID=A0ABV7K707_9HYPH